jgi:hypothetical protein
VSKFFEVLGSFGNQVSSSLKDFNPFAFSQ